MAAVISPKNWQVTRLAGALGAEIHGIDLRSVSDDDIAVVRELLREHLVLFFPGQNLTQDEHVEFGRHFGELEGHPNLRNSSTAPEIFELIASDGGIADEWHSDLTFMPNPSVMSILHMVKCPSAGGDTMWSSMYAAYEALSPPIQELCDGLSALHDAHPHDRSEKTAIHPVVRVHPETGRKSLFVNEHFTRRIVEMSSQESDMLLPFLTNWVQKPQFTVRYHWSAGTIGMWDNRCTQHYVLNDFNEERVIQRVTVMGDTPEAGGQLKWEPRVKLGRGSAMARHDRQLGRHLKLTRQSQFD